MREADLWEQVEGGAAQCLLCPHACRIPAGSSGVCGVRRNEGGRLVAASYGAVSSIAVDPIEKKPVFHYRPGTRALSLGSVGCTMRCLHCQNWTISRARLEDGGIRRLSPDDVIALARAEVCEGIAFTYNEPVIWAEFVRDTAAMARSDGLYTVMVTNGYITAAGLDYLGPYIDVWRVDVKGADDETYRRLCKVRSATPVLEGAVRAKERWGMHVEVVTNVVPSINDSDDSARDIARWIRDFLGPKTPWHVTRFFPYLELAHLPPTPIDTLRRFKAIGAEEGLAFVYLGNVAEPGGEDTVCPRCGARAIERDGYRVLERATRDGACARCGEPLELVE
ncbi:MAG: AmmeMemoRadiSam system radical SAM enzyme [Coriobacteriia bacterium]|nr:AmmeMemoRadiSam system radical SAM enzyme [Coriobacteriia bacterium]